MLLIGLTGGVGMGKSTVAEHLRVLGEQIVDTDEIARRMVEPGQPALDEIVREFGAEMLRSDGTLHRAALAQVVFAQPERRRTLERILHPRIRAEWLEQAAQWRRRGLSRGIVVIPLLFETNAERELGLTICVACSERTQWRRLRMRGWSDEEISNRVASQLSIREKMDRADRVVWNESTLEMCGLQAEQALRALPAGA